MKTQTATITKTATGINIDDTFKTWLKSQPDGDYHIKIIKEPEYRSNQQNRLYWSAWLSVILYYLPEGLLSPEPKNNHDMHDFLMFGYGIRKGAITTIKYKGFDIPIRPSWSFDKMSKQDANEYLEFVQSWVCDNLGHSIDELITQKERES